MITIGIDSHKSSHAAVALAPTGRVVGEIRTSATKTTTERLLRWAQGWPERAWTIEGAAGLGHLLAQQLVARQETVLDVPATLAARVRPLARGHGRKTDGIDAVSVELGLADDREIAALGEVLTQQPVGVLVAAPLPEAVSVTEVDRHVGREAEALVLRELGASIRGQALPQLHGQCPDVGPLGPTPAVSVPSPPAAG